MKRRTSRRASAQHKGIEAALERGISKAVAEHLLNDFCARLDFYDRDKRKEVWMLLEHLAVKRKLVKKTELAKSAGAKANGPGLRFKTWLQGLVFVSTTLSEKAVTKRAARAADIVKTLDIVLDLAWEAFRDTIVKGAK